MNDGNFAEILQNFFQVQTELVRQFAKLQRCVAKRKFGGAIDVRSFENLVAFGIRGRSFCVVVLISHGAFDRSLLDVEALVAVVLHSRLAPQSLLFGLPFGFEKFCSFCFRRHF